MTSLLEYAERLLDTLNDILITYRKGRLPLTVSPIDDADMHFFYKASCALFETLKMNGKLEVFDDECAKATEIICIVAEAGNLWHLNISADDPDCILGMNWMASIWDRAAHAKDKLAKYVDSRIQHIMSTKGTAEYDQEKKRLTNAMQSSVFLDVEPCVLVTTEAVQPEYDVVQTRHFYFLLDKLEFYIQEATTAKDALAVVNDIKIKLNRGYWKWHVDLMWKHSSSFYKILPSECVLAKVDHHASPPLSAEQIINKTVHIASIKFGGHKDLIDSLVHIQSMINDVLRERAARVMAVMQGGHRRLGGGNNPQSYLSQLDPLMLEHIARLYDPTDNLHEMQKGYLSF